MINNKEIRAEFKQLNMAKVKIEDILEHLDSEIRGALEQAVKEHFPNQPFDVRTLYRTFLQKVYTRCSTWERVPDRYVKPD